jgi:predicted O-methyltransferase YrrM
MNLYSVSKFLKYILLSQHGKGHGIHSPFVFDLVSRVFRNKIDPDIVCSIERIRKQMISDQRLIVINDLGSGSYKMKSKKRRVSDITRYSSVPGKYGVLLANMSLEFGKPLIIEFGTSVGISTMYLAAVCPDAMVYTMEGCPEISKIASENFNKAGLKNIRIFTGSFEKIIPEIKNENTCPGLVFIDGNHRKEPLIDYFNHMADISGNNTVIIIDDIYCSKEMGEAWNEITLNEKVSLTIDINRMGLVFFRKGAAHYDYNIRY